MRNLELIERALLKANLLVSQVVGTMALEGCALEPEFVRQMILSTQNELLGMDFDDD